MSLGQALFTGSASNLEVCFEDKKKKNKNWIQLVVKIERMDRFATNVWLKEVIVDVERERVKCN